MDVLEQLEEYLDELEIKYFLADKLEGSDYEGYVCVYIEPEDFSMEVLEKLGFKKIEHNFYYMELSSAEEVNEETLKELKLIYSNQYRLASKKEELRRRLLELKQIWTQAANKIYEINLFFLKKHGREFFTPTLETLDRALKLPSLIVKNEISCHDFCYFLYQIAHESVIEETKDYLCQILIDRNPSLISKQDAQKHLKNDLLENDPFYEDILQLRNHYIHIKGSQKGNPKENCKNMFNRCSESRGLYKVNNDYEYYQFQVRILKDFLRYLEKIEDVIKIKI